MLRRRLTGVERNEGGKKGRSRECGESKSEGERAVPVLRGFFPFAVELPTHLDIDSVPRNHLWQTKASLAWRHSASRCDWRHRAVMAALLLVGASVDPPGRLECIWSHQASAVPFAASGLVLGEGEEEEEREEREGGGGWGGGGGGGGEGEGGGGGAVDLRLCCPTPAFLSSSPPDMTGAQPASLASARIGPPPPPPRPFRPAERNLYLKSAFPAGHGCTLLHARVELTLQSQQASQPSQAKRSRDRHQSSQLPRRDIAVTTSRRSLRALGEKKSRRLVLPPWLVRRAVVLAVLRSSASGIYSHRQPAGAGTNQDARPACIERLAADRERKKKEKKDTNHGRERHPRN